MRVNKPWSIKIEVFLLYMFYFNKINKLTLRIILVFLISIPLLADEEPWDKSKELYTEITVNAQRNKKNEIKKKESGFVREIYLEDYENRTADLAELLDDVPGLHVKKYGSSGGYSTISLRGSSANQVTILIDGIPIDSAQSGVVNLGEIPISNLEKIEIYQSNIPVEFNTAPIGGVVNLITKKSHGTKSLMKLTGGSFDTYSSQFLSSYNSDPFEILGLFSNQKSRGNFKYLDKNGTEFNENDDEIVKRKNNKLEEYNLFFKGSYDFTDEIRIQLSNNFDQNNQGLPGIGSIQTDDTEMHTTKNMINLMLDWKEFLTPIMNFSANTFYSYQNQHFVDPDGELGIGKSMTDDITDRIGQNFLFKIYPVEVISITTSLGIKEEIFKPWDELSKPSRDGIQKRDENYASSSVELHLFEHKVILQGALRYNHFKSKFEKPDVTFAITKTEVNENITEDFYSPSQGIIIKPFDFLTLKGNIGRYYRVPNYIELFGLDGTIIGNQDLAPEKSNNWDSGFFFDIKDFYIIDYFNIEYSYFDNEVEDLIQFQMISSTMSKAFNTDSAQIRGHEISLDFSIFKHFKFLGNYTFMNAVNTTSEKNLENNKLPFRPKEEGIGRLTTYFEKFEVFCEADFMREVFLNPANNDKVPERTIYNAGFSIKPLKLLEVAFEVKNFTDNRVFDMRNFPLPGINYSLSIKICYP
jgi:iron complex outermembrane recepter protein